MGADAEIGALLRGARCAARYTQAQVGKACGYSASAVSRIESGKLRIDYPTLLKFAAFLRIAPEQLRASAVPGMTNVATVAGGCLMAMPSAFWPSSPSRCRTPGARCGSNRCRWPWT